MFDMLLSVAPPCITGHLVLSSIAISLKFFGEIEILAHRIGLGAMLAQDIQLQLVWPSVPVGHTAAGGVMKRALLFGCHVFSPFVFALCAVCIRHKGFAVKFPEPVTVPESVY
jgi:hypothetical protein